MRYRTATLALALLAARMAAAQPVAFDFERGAKGWVGLYDAPKVATHDAKQGRACFVLKTDGAVNREYHSPLFPIDSKTRYRVSAWVKVERFDQGYSPLTINIRWYFEPRETCSFGGWNVFRVLPDAKPRTFGWRRIERIVEPHKFKRMVRPITHARIQIRNYRTSGAAYVDDIRIEPLPKEASK